MSAYAKKRIMSRNLFDKNAIEYPAYIRANGTVNSTSGATGYAISDYIPVSAGDYVAHGLQTRGNLPHVAVYDENQELIRTVQIISNEDLHLTIGNNEKYVRLSVRMADNEYQTAMFNAGAAALPYEPYGEGVWVDCAVKKRIMSRNLFDAATMVNEWHGYINANDVSYGASSWRITDYIPCDGTDFVLSKVGGNTPAICAYDANKRLITGKAYQSGGSSTKIDVFLHTSATAKYIRFSFYGDTDDPSSYIDPSTLMLSEGTTVLPVEPYNTPIWVDTDIKKTRLSNNLFNINGTDTSNGFLPGQYINTNDTPVTPSETGMPSNTSEYIPISPNTDYYISGMPTDGYNSPSVCWYDANKTRIAGQRYQNRGYVSFTAPSNAAYMRISYPIAYASQVMANVGTSALPYEPYGSVWDDGAF